MCRSLCRCQGIGFKPPARDFPAVWRPLLTLGVCAMELDSCFEGGAFFTGVVHLHNCGGPCSCQGLTVQHGYSVRIYLDKAVDWNDIQRITLLNFLIQQDAEGWLLIQTGQGAFFLHGPFEPTALQFVKETCCGIGALGRGLTFLGYKVVAQNDVQLVTVKEAAKLSGATPVHGDVSSLSTVRKLWEVQPGDCTLAAGVACQPYSRLGDRKSSQDDRSSSLPGTLRAAYLMQSSCIILECVPQVLEDVWFQDVLRIFSKVTGHVASQTVLSLRQVWTAKRERWWCVLACQEIAPSLVPWKPHGPWRSVSDVIDCFNVGQEEEIALSLTPYELESFASLRPIASYCTQMNQPMPTALHSWGSPLSACPCGCRSAPFRWSRLQQHGICSVLVPFHSSSSEHLFRFPSAAETALLNGLTPCLDFGEPRLSLALVGQLASPLQSAWIGVQIADKLSRMGVNFPSSMNGVQVLRTQRRLLLRDAEVMGFRPMTVSGSCLIAPPSCMKHTRGCSSAIARAQLTPLAQALQVACPMAPIR